MAWPLTADRSGDDVLDPRDPAWLERPQPIYLAANRRELTITASSGIAAQQPTYLAANNPEAVG